MSHRDIAIFVGLETGCGENSELACRDLTGREDRSIWHPTYNSGRQVLNGILAARIIGRTYDVGQL